MLTIDGARGEGGGQMLRTSLALSLVTGTSFRMINIRARRERPGLRPQHVAAVHAAATVGRASIDGDSIGSRDIVFRPGSVRPGDYRFDIGTAGSTGLVLQTVLPPLLTASGPSLITLAGGTHNPLAPPFDFLAGAFLPLVERTGARLSATLERYGFYPAGGGTFSVMIEPVARLAPLVLLERGRVLGQRARAIVAKLPASIAERELAILRRRLGLDVASLNVVAVADTAGPGNAVVVEIASECLTEVFTAIGARGVPAEDVADRAARETAEYLAADVPVGPHLADQLLIPLAMAGSGAFRTMPVTTHSTTNVDVIRRFVRVDFAVAPSGRGSFVVEACAGSG
jgi:RNA 3'-terminal phosphate cyclase (ATP)